MVRLKSDRPRGILHLRAGDAIPAHQRFLPGNGMAPFVEHYWTVEWDVREPVTREVLPHPSVHLVLQHGQSRIVGIPSGRFTRTLEGRGRVLGVKFRPGGFRPFVNQPVRAFTGQTLPIDEWLGAESRALEAAALAERDPARAFDVVDSFLERMRPAPDPRAERVAEVVHRVAGDQGITTVADLTRESGLGARALQRLFAEYVGVSPKWVIQRYRLHEAAERIAAGTVRDWATLALELGYADQAHFIRDFRRWVGASPAGYARALRRADQPSR